MDTCKIHAVSSCDGGYGMAFDIEKISVITNAQERCIGKCNYIFYIGDSFEHFRSSYTSIRFNIGNGICCTYIYNVIRTFTDITDRIGG